MDQVKFVWKTAFKKFEVIMAEADHITSTFLKAVFHKFHMVDSWLRWPKCNVDSIVNLQVHN